MYKRQGGFAPSWILALWLGFALTVNHSLGWLQEKPWLAALLAALFAPVSYLAGERLGAVTVANPSGLLLVSVAWCALFYGVFARIGLVNGFFRERRMRLSTGSAHEG